MAENVNDNHEGVSVSISESDYDPDYLKDVIKNDPEVKSRFLKIIGDEPQTISEKSVHAEATVRANGDLGIFYRYFFSKYVSIRLKQDAKSDVIDDHASIFPFQVKAADLLNMNDMPTLDDKFSTEIEEFVNKHFGDSCDVVSLKNLLWANIKDFKENHFPEPPSLDILARLIEVGSPLQKSSPSGENNENFPQSDYLKNFIRLKRGGTDWYQNFQTKFNETCKVHEKNLTLPSKRGYHFRFLPDINCCELLLLLETKFYEINREKYVHLFKKYLFFFKNASDRKEHPVCFIDEALFVCLQFKKEYETFREDKSILDCVWELCVMTLVHCRRYPLDLKQKKSLKPDQSDLEKVVAYADKLLKDVQSVSVYYGEPQYPRFKVFLLLDDTVFLIHYSGRQGSASNDLPGQILKSALLSREIKKLKFYNAYLGKETIYEMPQKIEEIRAFIRQLTETERVANRLEPEYPMKFLILPNVRKYFSILPAIPHY